MVSIIYIKKSIRKYNVKGFSTTSVQWGILRGLDGKESACNAGDLGSIPGSGRFPGVGNGNPLQSSYLKIPLTDESGSPWGHKESEMTEYTHINSHIP